MSGRVGVGGAGATIVGLRITPNLKAGSAWSATPAASA